MSELDRIYQEYYAQVTAKIWADYEDFKVKKADYYPKAQIEKFQYLLLSICGNFSRSYENPEIEKTNYLFTEFNHFRTKLVEYFRRDTKKYLNYQRNPVDNFLEEENLEKIADVSGYPSIMPSKEILAKTLAFYDAYVDVYEQLKIELENENSIPPMSAQQTLLQWLAEGENERVVKALQTIANQYGDKYFVNDVVHQAGRYSSLKKKEQQNIIDERDAGIELAKIRQALLDLINKVPDNATLVNIPTQPAPTLVATTPNQTPSAPQPQTPPNAPQKHTQAKTNPNLPWMIGLGLALLIVALVVFFPDANNKQFFVFRFILAAAIAGLVSVIPGILRVSIKNYITGTGAIAAFLIVLFYNPPSIEEAKIQEPFEFTINLQPDKNTVVSAQYPKLENATLQLWINNKWEDATVSGDNLADFKSIPGELKDQTVPIRFATNKYWKLLQDSVTLSGKSQVLTIAPDGLLGTVSGKVRSEQDATFLSGVEIEIEGVLDTTDTRGNFNIAIPPDKQKSRYIYIAQKPGYQTKTEPFEFDGEPIEIRLRKQ